MKRIPSVAILFLLALVILAACSADRQTTPQGSLAISIEGLPAGVSADATLSGPGGHEHTVDASRIINNLTPGSYTLTAAEVEAGGRGYLPDPESQSLTVTAGATASATVRYSLRPSPEAARLEVSISGLPGDALADVTVTGPANYSHKLTASTMLEDLSPGDYTVTALSVAVDGTIYVPTPASQRVSLAAGESKSVSVAYSAPAGSLRIEVLGLPDDLAADVTVVGPEGYSQSVASSTTLSGLTPGAYLVGAQDVSGNGGIYQPEPSSQEVTVTSNATATATVTYELQDPGPVPHITEPQPNPLELSAEVGQSATGSFSFGNDGTAELDYTAGQTADWLEITGGQEGSVAPGENATVSVQATCPEDAGAYSAEVTISSNDPDEPIKSVAVDLGCAAGPSPDPVIKLTAADAAAHDHFGHAVAIDGDTLAVAALQLVYGEEYGIEKVTGAVYVFERQGTNWVEQAKLTPPPADDAWRPEGLDAFGSSVAISGDTIVVGAPTFVSEDMIYGSYAFYVFEREGSSWVQRAKLEGHIGWAGLANLAIDGNTIVAGRPQDEIPGQANVFEQEAGTWTHQVSLSRWDLADDDYEDDFGWSVAVSGDTIAVSTRPWSGFPSGAYIFRKTGEAWTEHVKIEGEGAVDISEDTVVFGNRVFRLEGSNVVQQATLDWQGRAIDGNTIVAGSGYDSAWPELSEGVHVVTYDGTNWVNQGELVPHDQATASALGRSVAVSGNTIVVGAPNDSEAGEQAGAVYVFQR
jgi:hypothetical protein